MKTCVALFVLAVSSAATLGQLGLPDRPADMVYYADSYAEYYGVPRELVRAVISQESGWNPRAVSEKGAMGAMQLMPDTARQYGVLNPFDPQENIAAGTRYLADLIAYFGDWRLALASYFCGPTHPAKRGLEYSNPDVVRYVRSIQIRYIREQLLLAPSTFQFKTNKR